MMTHIANLLSFNAPETLWLWLFPATYLIHIAEEFWGGDGFSEHLRKTRGVKLKKRDFFLMTGLSWLGMVVLIVFAERLKFPELMLVIFGTAFLANGLSHTATALRKAKYNPGLVTAILLWIPQGAITLARLAGAMSSGRYLMGMLIGLVFQLTATLLSMVGGKVKVSQTGGEGGVLSGETL
jgi:hypothetical protein